jgi:[ribosomal protein S5]-alanine N-acetyltransferase
MGVMTHVALETTRLVLRPMADSDADDYVTLHCNEAVARKAGRATIRSPEESRERFRNNLERQASGECFVWTLRRRDDDTFVGAISLRSLDRAPHARSLGYEMLPDFWGQGYMAEAVRALVAHAFSAMAFHRIEATTSPQNVPSQRVLERAGFTREGVLRDAHRDGDGRYSDNIVYSRLATDV